MFPDEDLHMVLRVAHDKAGLLFEPEKRYLVESRLQKLAQEKKTDVAAILAALRAGDAAMQADVAEAMTVQETYFFRDPWLFESLREDVLPQLMQRRAATQELRIWCAACATGQEPWSIALLLAGMPALANWDVEILATDFSPAALAKAASGRYSHMEVNRGLPARELAVHFRRDGLDWVVASDIRRRVRFQRLNLIEDWPELPAFDIVLLRNVLIYFDEATKRDVLGRVRAVMRGDGILFMGGAESPLGLDDAFRPSISNRACYYFLGEET